MDTRVTVYTLIDYDEFYGQTGDLAQALNIIRNIPSITLLNYISGFSVNLYLRENFKDSGKVQFNILESIMSKLPGTRRLRWIEIIRKCEAENQSPVIIWNYSNLMMYDLIFKRFNKLKSRDLTGNEALAFFNAYLMVNSVANRRIKVEEDELLTASENNSVEEITIPSFIYQKDFASTYDFSNQIVRGVMLFRYLEAHHTYGKFVNEYYSERKVSGHLRLFKNLLTLFTELKIGDGLEERNQLVNLEPYANAGEIDPAFIDAICINDAIRTYKKDDSFGQLRKTVLYKFDRYLFFVLNVNFLIDQVYKAQVFAFNAFLKSKGQNDFLSIKAKEFMEGQYLPMVISNCFPDAISYFDDQCINSKNEELCDAYVRFGGSALLIEFKDVLLAADAKNSGDKDVLFGEFDKKFVENQKKRPKGITQLINAIGDIEANGVLFDQDYPKDGLIIYPIILYTDLSFGHEGINKILREKFASKLEEFKLSNCDVRDVTLINLNFFELHEAYLSTKHLDIVAMLNEYHSIIKLPEFQLTPFEVFSRSYMNENVTEELPESIPYKQMLEDIENA